MKKTTTARKKGKEVNKREVKLYTHTVLKQTTRTANKNTIINHENNI